MSDTILVTGASGLLGANFLRVAGRKQRSLFAQYFRHPIELPGVRSVPADLTDVAAVRQLFAQAQPGWVIHCAAATNVDWCEENPAEARRINLEASRAVAREAQRSGARLIHISTDAVFDGMRGNYSEADPVRPVNVYSRTKADAESAVQAELASAVVVRTAIYGWNYQPKHTLGEWVVAELSAGRGIVGFTDLFFSPILADHLAEILLQTMEGCPPGLYHVAAADSCSKYDFCRRLARAFGLNESLIRPGSDTDALRPARRPKNLSLDTGKIARVLNRTMPTVDEGIDAFHALRGSGFPAMRQGETHAQS